MKAYLLVLFSIQLLMAECYKVRDLSCAITIPMPRPISGSQYALPVSDLS